MPYYDYKCNECEEELEIQHSIKDDAIEHRTHIKRGGYGEKCHGKLTRLISKSTGFTFTGGSPTPKFHG
jgi:predicted nucleic acid-binding Zn ribbon protein